MSRLLLFLSATALALSACAPAPTQTIPPETCVVIVTTTSAQASLTRAYQTRCPQTLPGESSAAPELTSKR